VDSDKYIFPWKIHFISKKFYIKLSSCNIMNKHYKYKIIGNLIFVATQKLNAIFLSTN